ncbi:MAG: adenosylcobinamide-phosphate synthase CbiB [Acidobacteriota bacterium]|jgi:adenosylcobinamide-phosphate synthase|nr:adenosylcobinamide-phosphate synthase CbiB [Acidobacteriota bacterium]
MRFEYLILTAFVLDLLIGDPRWFPHPVRLIGALAVRSEKPLRRLVKNPRLAGVLVVFIVVGASGLAAFILMRCAAWVHPLAGDAVSVLLLYTTFASHDLMRHSRRVYVALWNKNLVEARRRVAMLVGRDTDNLTEPEVVRATVESVAENIVDGVTAPIFFAVLAGPVGAMAYKAINTLDSTFGYKDERYLLFGWASARLDDVANYIPARLTAPLVALASVICGFMPLRSVHIFLRDGRKHDSPNSGLTEAAVAGALGVQLGGLNYYAGEACECARMGDPWRTLHRRDILAANLLMLGTSILCLLLLLGVRMALFNLWEQ